MFALSKKLYNKFILSLILGFHSGIIYGLLSTTFTAYLVDRRISITVIAMLYLRMLPYSFKFFWAPFIDHKKIGFFQTKFGQRKSWLITMQFFLVITLLLLALTDIHNNFYLTFFLITATALFAATFDTAMEAYRVELFNLKESSKGIMLNVIGFRIGLLTTGALALYLTTIISWHSVFILTAFIVLFCMIPIYYANDSKVVDSKVGFFNLKKLIRQYFFVPIASLLNKPHAKYALLLVAFYKLSDACLDALNIVFLLNIGYHKSEIACISQPIGIVAGMFGAYCASYLIEKYSFRRLLFTGEILAAMTNLMFIVLTQIPHNLYILGLLYFCESFCSGICNILLIYYMSSLCNKKFTGTHYTFLFSTSSLSRVLISSISGVIATQLGWILFFVYTAILAIPSLIIIYLLPAKRNGVLTS